MPWNEPSPRATLLQRVRNRLRPAQPDFADHGTAFGMELTLAPAYALETEQRLRPGPGAWQAPAEVRATASFSAFRAFTQRLRPPR